MEYMTLNDGVRMPMVGFGTFQIGGEACEEAVRTAVRTGYRMIDTAEAYGNEAAVGAGIKASGVARDELFLVTKVNFRSYEHARETVMRSLESLGTDYLDLVLLHWPFGNYYAAWRELERLQQEGTVRAVGVSNFDPDRLIDLISFNEVRPAVNQIETNLYCQRHAEHTWEDRYGVAHMAYAPLGQGHRGEMFDEPAVREIAARHGKTPAQVILRRTLQDRVAVIPKSVHPERMRENLDILDFSLTDAEMAELRALDRAAPLIGNAEDPEKTEMAMTW